MSSSTFEENGREYLEHYGVKGMRWGVRKSRDSGPKKSFAQKNVERSNARKKRNQDIKNARVEVQKLEKKLGRAEDNYYKATTKKGEKKALSELSKLESQYLDASSVAKKTTTGEKWMIAGAAYLALNVVSGVAQYHQMKNLY